MTDDTLSLRPLANAIRALSMDAVERAQSGHPGMPMGMADVATVLYARHLTFSPQVPNWPNRDRLVLSAGHGSMLLYALGYLTGYDSITLDDLKAFRQLGSRTPGHPEHDIYIGVETTTGPLGQGLATAVGLALAERISRERFGPELFSHYTYVIAGDGDMQEGITHEAASLAGHWGLSKLIILYDDNGISIDGPTALSFSEDVCARYAAYGFATKRIDGHDMAAIDAALAWAKNQDQPVLIACRTTIGFGAGAKAGTADAHGAPLGPTEIATARQNLAWPHAPFDIPEDILNAWRKIGARHFDAVGAWDNRFDAAPEALRQQWIHEQRGVDTATLDRAITAAMAVLAADPKPIATRKASQIVLEHLVPALPHLIGGSADLTGSNLTKVKGHEVAPRGGAQNFPSPSQGEGQGGGQLPISLSSIPHPNPPPERGRGQTVLSSPYIHYGVREHGMAAIMNGLALYGGYIPYGGTFLCFADYLRPALRLAALMRQQVIYVMTHDSIGLGEDGPTHQPIEHLASLRAMPHVLVLRPADATETAKCWHAALSYHTGPSILALSRQNISSLPQPNAISLKERGVHRGGYIVRDADQPRVVIFATGSEVSLALAAAATLDASLGGACPVRVVSMPCLEMFMNQDHAYRDAVLGRHAGNTPPLLVAIEAGVRQGWDAIIGSDGLFFGLDDFGASGKYQDIYNDRGLEPMAIAEKIRAAIK